MQTVLITGGTGFIGKSLVKYLSGRGFQIIILTRSPNNYQSDGHITYAAWNVKNQEIDIAAMQSADFIIHLAGAGVVEKKWTHAYKKEILESRTLSSKLLIDTLKNNPHKVKAIISASAIGWYGPDKEHGKYFVETDIAASDFLGQTCQLWEQSIEPAEALGIRVCKLRTGIVLSNNGGALEEFKKPIRSGIAAILSTGKQMISWVHMEDLCRMYLHAIENDKMHGSYNAVAPSIATNKELTLMLATSMRGRFFVALHVPGIILKIMLGSRSIEVLKSSSVSCRKVQETGFTFLYPSIEAALQELKNNP